MGGQIILYMVALWRNGSASDSRSEGCVFKSRQGHSFFTINGKRDIVDKRKILKELCIIQWRCIKTSCHITSKEYMTFHFDNLLVEDCTIVWRINLCLITQWWYRLLQVRLELTTSALLCWILLYKYRALTDCATGALYDKCTCTWMCTCIPEITSFKHAQVTLVQNCTYRMSMV